MLKQSLEQRHGSSPTLNTVRMVEQALQAANESVVSVAELKRRLPRQVNHNTLKAVLEYLEESNKIAVSLKGLTWISNDNPRLREAVARGLEP